MLKLVLSVFLLILIPSILCESNAYLGGDLIDFDSNLFSNQGLDSNSKIINFVDSLENNSNLKRYLVFGSGSTDELFSYANKIGQTASSSNGFFSIVVMEESDAPFFVASGYNVIEDFELDFNSNYVLTDNQTDISQMESIAQSKKIHDVYNVTGKGIRIAIIDTGVDFSNPDVRHSLARDENNFPIMLDADGQGIILTNATFVANIDKYNIIKNHTSKSLSIFENMTSKVYAKPRNEGVFLDVAQGDVGTNLLVYNSFFPYRGQSPLLNGTLSDDMKIGQNKRDYIESKSGVYRLGVILQSFAGKVQVVPVLVVDSEIAGKYDTIIPDLSTSWEDFINTDDEITPNYDFDFTDEKPIKLGSGDEFLIYDFDGDGEYDYSAGTIGAHVLDIYGVIENEAKIDEHLGAINGTLLPPMDSNGEFFGLMTDSQRHGTASAATISSKGLHHYDIYNNTKKFTLRGVAPDAQIIPVKALWFGDVVYAWLWSAGFENNNDKWKFSGTPKADIISNSWGVSNFPNTKHGSGLDMLSLIMNSLVIPGTLADDYPGVLMVSSAGNSGHGYGTLGLPNVSPFALSVGATTNNVIVGYGPFKDEPRFGNTTQHSDDVIDFSSRGPSIIGDPKPDLMAIGAYGFTPSSVTKIKEDSKQEPFTLFGGTSMSAPIVSGSAALVMQALNDKSEDYEPIRIKNILMSTADDLYNDVMTQGSGLTNPNDAVKFAKEEGNIFIVYNDESASNIKEILEKPLQSINSTEIGFDKIEIPIENIKQTSWFGGRLSPGESTSTTFTIENPTNNTLNIKIQPQNLELIKTKSFDGNSEVHVQDPILNKSKVYRPGYIKLDQLFSNNDNSTTILNDSNLLVLNSYFDFDSFMNKTDTIYADDMKIASLYLYDWDDKDDNTEISSDELSLVNRGGSWGTVQELRVSEPSKKFDNVPVVGIYSVPTKYSYWSGNSQINSTSMNYTLSGNIFAKNSWEDVEINNQNISESWNDISNDGKIVSVSPHSTSEITAVIKTKDNQKPGIYQGFITFKGEEHTVNVPVSYAVSISVEKDKPIVILGSKNESTLYGTGYVKGAFDMSNRYMAGDWRQYYFDIDDPTINSGAIELSWENDDTNFSTFMIDPNGKIIQTNVDSGVFGHFLNWPTVDWLGSTSFSQGGGFFPVKNKDNTSTVMFAPINQTGTYSLLIHSTLFDGSKLTEAVSVAAKFTTILPDNSPPEILLSIPEYVNTSNKIIPEIIEANLEYVKYFLDGNEIEYSPEGLDLTEIQSGNHELKIYAKDILGLEQTKTYSFIVDNLPPKLQIKSPQNNTIVSNTLPINIKVDDANLLDENAFVILMPNGERIKDKSVFNFDTSKITNGQHKIEIFAKDKALNQEYTEIFFYVDHSLKDEPVVSQEEFNVQDNFLFILIPISIAIIVGIFFAIRKKTHISKVEDKTH